MSRPRLIDRFPRGICAAAHPRLVGQFFLIVDIRNAVGSTTLDVPFNWPSTVDQILDAPFLNDADKEAILVATRASG
jgi:hypothetical protein